MKKNKYVTNRDLLPYIFLYRETGIVSETLGGMLLKIAQNFANKGSFYNYTWKEDMIAEAVYTCLRYIHNFDPIRFEKPNPFAYFTSIIKNSFLNYIHRQKKHSKIKEYCYNTFFLLNEFDDEDDFGKTKGIDYTVLKDDGQDRY